MAPSHDHAVTLRAAPRIASAAILVLGLVAGCGGDRSRAPGGGDTTSPAVMTPDTAGGAQSAPADTGSKPATSAAPAPAPAAPAPAPSANAAPANPAPAKKPVAKAPKPSHDTAAAPSKQATADTTRPAQTGNANTAAAPTPAASPAQDSSKAAAPSQAEQPLRDAYHQAPHDTVSQAVYDGWKQFNLNCARCHGEDVLGTTIAPHLILSLKPDGPINTKELFVQTVCAGRPAKGMPSWCALGLDMGKINNIYEYVKGRSDAKISPGRPAVKQQG
jgi:hypothetical protein